MPGPRRNGEGPASHRQPLCCRRGNQPLYVRHVFLFVFFFMSLMWAREGGDVSPPLPSLRRCSALFCPPPPKPIFLLLLLPPICPHLFLLFSPPSTPLSPLPFLPFFVSLCFYPWRSFVKAPCLDGPYLCRWVVAFLSHGLPHPPFFNFYLRIWHKVAFFVFFPRKWYSRNSKTT